MKQLNEVLKMMSLEARVELEKLYSAEIDNVNRQLLNAEGTKLYRLQGKGLQIQRVLDELRELKKVKKS